MSKRNTSLENNVKQEHIILKDLGKLLIKKKQRKMRPVQPRSLAHLPNHTALNPRRPYTIKFTDL
jgi:hypothetical protein